jgi:hypothetical protein
MDFKLIFPEELIRRLKMTKKRAYLVFEIGSFLIRNANHLHIPLIRKRVIGLRSQDQVTKERDIQKLTGGFQFPGKFFIHNGRLKVD